MKEIPYPLFGARLWEIRFAMPIPYVIHPMYAIDDLVANRTISAVRNSELESWK